MCASWLLGSASEGAVHGLLIAAANVARRQSPARLMLRRLTRESAPLYRLFGTLMLLLLFGERIGTAQRRLEWRLIFA